MKHELAMTSNISEISSKIINRLPYGKDFLFVDEISYVDETKIIGHYSFDNNAFFYKSHFIHKPETPGVLLIETMGQIGMVCHIIFLNKLYENTRLFRPVLSNIESSFLKPISPNQKITIIAEKIYYRNNILKSNIKLLDSLGNICVLCKVHLQLIYD